MPNWNLLLSLDYCWICFPLLKHLLHCSAPLLSVCCCLPGLPFPAAIMSVTGSVVPSIGFLFYNDFWFNVTILTTLLHLGDLVAFSIWFTSLLDLLFLLMAVLVALGCLLLLQSFVFSVLLLSFSYGSSTFLFLVSGGTRTISGFLSFPRISLRHHKR